MLEISQMQHNELTDIPGQLPPVSIKGTRLTTRMQGALGLVDHVAPPLPPVDAPWNWHEQITDEARRTSDFAAERSEAKSHRAKLAGGVRHPPPRRASAQWCWERKGMFPLRVCLASFSWAQRLVAAYSMRDGQAWSFAMWDHTRPSAAGLIAISSRDDKWGAANGDRPIRSRDMLPRSAAPRPYRLLRPRGLFSRHRCRGHANRHRSPCLEAGQILEVH